MAKVKFSALVSEMRNKLNGSVFSKNRYGSYLRNKVTPVNPQTASQVNVRSRFAAFSQNWRSLTEEQREAWRSSVSDWATTNIFGDLTNPTGSNLYQKVNSNISIAGGTVVDLPPNKVGVDSVLEISLVAEEGTPTFEITFDPAPIPTGHAMVVEATKPVSAGINNFKSQFRQITVLPATTTGTQDLITEYTAKFGTLTAGKKVAVRVKMIRLSTGEVSQSLQAQTIVTA